MGRRIRGWTAGGPRQDRTELYTRDRLQVAGGGGGYVSDSFGIAWENGSGIPYIYNSKKSLIENKHP